MAQKKLNKNTIFTRRSKSWRVRGEGDSRQVRSWDGQWWSPREFLKAIKHAVQAESRVYEQRAIVVYKDSCGTMACLGGFGLALTAGPNAVLDTDEGRLGTQMNFLVPDNAASDWLFASNWIYYRPELGKAYQKAKTPRQRAEVACHAIDIFMKENGL